MKEIKNEYDIVGSLKGIKKKVGLKDVLIALSVTLGALGIVNLGWGLYFGINPLTHIIFQLLSVILAIPFITYFAYDFLTKYIDYKESNYEIDEFIDEINKSKINTTKEELKLSKVKEENEINDYVTLKNGKKAKRRKVTNYICINKKDKFQIYKQITKDIRSGLYRKRSMRISFMDNQDLIKEGLISENGDLTEKAKSLGLKLN